MKTVTLQETNNGQNFIYLPKNFCNVRNYKKGDVFVILNNDNKLNIILRKVDGVEDLKNV